MSTDTAALIADCVAGVLHPDPDTRQRAREAHGILWRREKERHGTDWDGFAGPDCIDPSTVRVGGLATEPEFLADDTDFVPDPSQSTRTNALQYIHEHPGCVNGEIARACRISPQHVTGILADWCKCGIVRVDKSNSRHWQYSVEERI